MVTKVEYFSARREPYPDWLEKGDYSLRNFFESRTVFYPGAGGDGRPLDIFNSSHSAHCYFFVDQAYSRTNLDSQTGDPPTGYKEVCSKQYSAGELKQESIFPLPKKQLQQFSSPAPLAADGDIRGYRSRDDSLLAAADANSAICLRIYERQPGYRENHGARRFAIFCLGMEARTAYEWFYGTMFRGSLPFAIWLQDHGLGGDFAKQTAKDRGFGDPDGRLYRAARLSGLPKFLIAEHGTRHWTGYRWIEGVQPRPDLYGHHLYKRYS